MAQSGGLTSGFATHPGMLSSGLDLGPVAVPLVGVLPVPLDKTQQYNIGYTKQDKFFYVY